MKEIKGWVVVGPGDSVRIATFRWTRREAIRKFEEAIVKERFMDAWKEDRKIGFRAKRATLRVEE